MVTLGDRELPYAAWCQLKNGFKGLVVNLHSATTMITYISDQGGNSISPKTPYRKISQSLGRARSVVGVFQLLWNLAGVSAFQSDMNILALDLALSRLYEILR